MSLKAMVFTSDRKLTAIFAASVAEMPLDWIWLQEMPLATSILNRERFDFLLTDCASEKGRSLIKLARRSEVNNNCTIFGVARETSEPRLLELGADIYLRCRLQSSLLRDRMRENLPLAKHDERKSRRYPVKIPISLSCGTENIPATALNLSTGGMMVQLEHEISKYEVLAIGFVLPEMTKETHIHARMVWQGANSMAGIRFLGVTDELRMDLAEWAQRQSNSPRN
jgi:hypothetical protein